MRTSNKVAINTIVQYTRLFLNLVIGLYSVRVILNALGASDYGVYDVVAGVIAILGFINASLSQTSIRYLSVSLGKNDLHDLRGTFSNSLWLHLLIGIALVFILEFVGLFLFDGFLNIPPDRISAAKIVFQCMCATLFLNISVTPFTALIISHEKFVYTSAVSILDSLLKLGIAFVLVYTVKDKLVIYGILTVGVTIINSILYVFYIVREYRTELKIGKLSIRGIAKQSGFAGWTIMDVFGSLATRQGYSIMLNKFFGTTTNAVFAIARQVEGQIYSVSAAVIDTMKPQIMKSYGLGDHDRMLRLSLTAGKLGFSMMALIAIPLLVMMPKVLELWLNIVPEGTVFFSRLLIFACMMSQLTQGLIYACQATGDIKWFSITVSSIRFSALPISIIFCLFGCKAYVSIIVFVVCETLGSFSRVIVMSKTHGLEISYFISQVIVMILPAVVFGLLFCFVYYRNYSSFVHCVINIIVTSLIYLGITYFWGLTKIERHAINGIFNSFVSKYVK